MALLHDAVLEQIPRRGMDVEEPLIERRKVPYQTCKVVVGRLEINIKKM
jgi:hypothetical protein